ncbi:hypothetical protein M427DRAFT_491108 [Gonapodya prolifera JEL478]|uniref:Uncharacterized protein n=1 Tax=Gonapodya prolifera (strain JEL478) TaxID=1344416 RepID=A0A139AN60_GONPJ|nr:hypothetical protein M427DRAFT_491108 [Gonapodya prolifera JEL478]|eukprot:KXS18054.1 hypothetical protein M427DRAFT_491108 [Gonapodya prolifera JEL478]
MPAVKSDARKRTAPSGSKSTPVPENQARSNGKRERKDAESVNRCYLATAALVAISIGVYLMPMMMGASGSKQPRQKRAVIPLDKRSTDGPTPALETRQLFTTAWKAQDFPVITVIEPRKADLFSNSTGMTVRFTLSDKTYAYWSNNLNCDVTMYRNLWVIAGGAPTQGWDDVYKLASGLTVDLSQPGAEFSYWFPGPDVSPIDPRSLYTVRVSCTSPTLPYPGTPTLSGISGPITFRLNATTPLKTGKTISDTGVWTPQGNTSTVKTELPAFRINQPMGGSYVVVDSNTQLAFQGLPNLSPNITRNDVAYCTLTSYRDLSDASPNSTAAPSWTLMTRLQVNFAVQWQTSLSVPLFATVPVRFDSTQYDRFSTYIVKVACTNTTTPVSTTGMYVGLSDPFKLYDAVQYGAWSWADVLNPPKTTKPAPAPAPTANAAPSSGPASAPAPPPATAPAPNSAGGTAGSPPGATTVDGTSAVKSVARKGSNANWIVIAVGMMVLFVIMQ